MSEWILGLPEIVRIGMVLIIFLSPVVVMIAIMVDAFLDTPLRQLKRHLDRQTKISMEEEDD